MPETSGRARGWVLPATAGVASVAFGVGIGELAAAVLAPSSSPFVVVGSFLIDLAPPWAKDAAIALFGTGDKAALLIGIGIVLVAVSGAAGVLEARRPPWGRVLVALIGVVGVVAAMTRANASMLAFAPSAIAAIAAILALQFLVRRLPVTDAAPAPFARMPRAIPVSSADAASTPSPDRAPEAAAARAGCRARAPTRPDRAVDRRRFLTWAGGAAVIGGLAAFGGYALQAGSRAVTAIRDTITLPKPTATATVPPSAELDIEGLTPVVTPNAQFYRIDTALAVPAVDPSTWSLRIHGMVDQEVTLTWDELLALPLEESATTLACVSNEVGGDLISNAKWLGVPVKDLLDRVEPDPARPTRSSPAASTAGHAAHRPRSSGTAATRSSPWG